MPFFLNRANGNKQLSFWIIFLVGFYLIYKIGETLLQFEISAVLALAACILFLPQILKKPSFSVFGFMFFASMPAFMGEGAALNIANLMWLLMMGLLFIQKGIQGRLWFTPLDRYLLLMGIVMVIAVFRNQFFFERFSAKEWLYNIGKPLQYCTIVYAIYNFFDNKSDIIKILYLNVFIATILSVVMLKVLGPNLTHHDALNYRTGGFWKDPNIVVMSFTFAVLTIVCLFNMKASRKGQAVPFRWVFLVGCTGILIMGEIFSYSRKGYIALPIGLLCYLFLQKRKGKTLLWIVGLFFVLQFIPQSVVERASSIISIRGGQIMVGGSVNSRIAMVESGFRYFAENPEKILIGEGFGGYERNAYQYGYHTILKFGRDPHNLYINTIFQSGLVGLFVLLLCYFKIYKKTCDPRKIGSDYDFRSLSSLVIAQLISYLLVYANGLTINLIWSTRPVTIAFLSTVACYLVLLKKENARVQGKIAQSRMG